MSQDQHTPRSIPVYRLTFWSGLSASYVSTGHGFDLEGIDGVICYINDILVTGSTDEQHLERLEKVLQRLKEYGLRVKKTTCDFCQPLVEYLGYQVDADGLHTLPSKVAAIVQAPEPENEQQL